MKPENEKLDQLISRLYEDETAEQVRREIEAGDALFDSYEVQGPDDAVMVKIADRMEQALVKRKSRKGLWYMFASAAAVIVFAFGLLLFSAGPGEPPAGNEEMAVRTAVEMEADFWTGDSLNENVQFAALTREIEDIEKSLALLSRGESIATQTSFDTLDYTDENENYGLTELEIEIVDTTESFWKG